MPLYLPKIFRLPLSKALAAIGDGESVTEVLQVLKNEGVIEGYDTILEIKVHRDKAVAVENFFISKDFGTSVPISKKKRGSQSDF